MSDPQWSILWIKDHELRRAGPFDSEGGTTQWAEEHNEGWNDMPGEFDITENKVYLLRPDYSVMEFTMEDLGVQEFVKGEV